MERNLIEELDKETVIKSLPAEDRIIIKSYESGSKQKEIAELIGRTQSYVSKRFEKLLERLEYERLNNGSRTVILIKRNLYIIKGFFVFCNIVNAGVLFEIDILNNLCYNNFDFSALRINVI